MHTLPNKTLSVSIPPKEEAAFLEHVLQYYVDETPAQRAAFMRFADTDLSDKAHDHLRCILADEHHPDRDRIRAFFTAIEKSTPIEPAVLTRLEPESFEACVRVLRARHLSASKPASDDARSGP